MTKISERETMQAALTSLDASRTISLEPSVHGVAGYMDMMRVFSLTTTRTSPDTKLIIRGYFGSLGNLGARYCRRTATRLIPSLARKPKATLVVSVWDLPRTLMFGQ